LRLMLVAIRCEVLLVMKRLLLAQMRPNTDEKERRLTLVKMNKNMEKMINFLLISLSLDSSS